LRQGVETQQHGGGVVVDDSRIFRARQVTQQCSHMIVTFATLARLQIEVECNTVTRCRSCGLDGAFDKSEASGIRKIRKWVAAVSTAFVLSATARLHGQGRGIRQVYLLTSGQPPSLIGRNA
jgi:hypothetical protein